MVRVGSARIDENGKLMGGQPGDQTGLEVTIEPWYSHPKKYVVARAKRASVRESIASDMEAACANDMIGYNQARSWDLYDKSKPYGWDCSKVKVASDVDCSTLVRTCVAYALQRDIPWFSTLNEIEKLSETGEFEILRDKKYSQSPDYLLRGDILCTATQGHTLVVLDNGAKAGQSSSQPPQNSTEGNTSLCGKGIGTAVALTPMNIRTGADTSAKKLDTIKASVAVEVLEITTSGWYKIVWPGESCGYAFTKAGSGYYSYSPNANAQVINLGDKVQFTGNKQYMSAWADKPITAVPEIATVTSICESGKHQYHIIGDNVYGWVNREDITRK
nr:MAG TPA: SH3 domain protein [Bacteriophage sp.]